MIKLILLILISLVIFIYYFYWIKAFLISAPYYPSNKRFKRKLLEVSLEHNLRTAVELGAGDGRLAVYMVKAGFDVTAIEINPVLYWLMKVRKYFGRLKKLRLIRGNFLEHTYHGYDLAIIYLYPKVMAKLEEKLFSEMKPGAIIVSNTFTFPNHKPLEKDGKFYVYKVPKRDVF